MKKYPKYKNTNIEWLDQIPEHWLDTKLKYVVKIKSGESIKSEEILPTGLFPVFGGNGIVGYTNDYNNEEEVLVIGRVGAKCGNVRLVSEKKWISDNALYAKTNIHKVFLLYKLESVNLNNLANKNAQPLITSTMINEQIIPLPPLPEQKAIAEYLDKKTSEIDQIIDAKKKLIALYNEEKSALINRAVTKGIDDKAKLKPSGVEWLGDIPQHWEVKKLKFVANMRSSNVDKKTKENEKKIELCNYVDVYKNDFIDSSISFMKASASDEQIKNFILSKDDVILTKDSESPDDIAIPALVIEDFDNVICGYHLAHIKPINILGGLLFRMLQSKFYKSYFKVASNGVTRYGIGIDKFNSVPILLPPLKEQEKIVEYIEKNVSVIDKKVANAKRLIELMTEYRTTLISEVVTGKVKVV